MKLTRGSFRTAYFGYILIAVLLANFIASPMVVYAIVSPVSEAVVNASVASVLFVICWDAV